MKKIFTVCLALLLTFSLSACGGANQAAETSSLPADRSAEAALAQELARDPADGSAEASTSAEISTQAETSAVLAPELEQDEEDDRVQHTYACSIASSATLSEQAAAEALTDVLTAQGDTLTVQSAESAEAQLQQLSELAGTADAVFLCPVDAEAMADGLKELASQGVVIFGFGGSWGAELPEGVTAAVTFEEYEAGYLCGMDLAEKLEDGGDAAVLTVSEQASAQRCLGFEEAAEESGAGIEPLEEQECASRKEAKATVAALLEEEPELAAVFAGSEELTLGALEAVEEAGSDCLVYGTDGSPELKAQLETETTALAGIGANAPEELAELLASLAGQYLDGEDVALSNSVTPVLIDASNVSSYGAEQWQ